jgi:hypothetical protein
MHSNFALEYTIRSVQVIQDGLKLNGIREYQVKCVERNVHTIREKSEALYCEY